MINIRLVFSYMDNDFTNLTLNFILFIFNIINFFFGLYLLVDNYEDLNTPRGIQDCKNIFLFISLSTFNSLTIIIGFSKLYIFSLLAFLFSFGLIIANAFNFNYFIGSNCSNYYKTNYSTFWYFYYATFGNLILNVFIYFMKNLLFLDIRNYIDDKMKIVNQNNSDTDFLLDNDMENNNQNGNSENRIHLINNHEHIYEDAN